MKAERALRRLTIALGDGGTDQGPVEVLRDTLALDWTWDG